MRYALLICTDETADQAMSPAEGEAQFAGQRRCLSRRLGEASTAG